MNPASSMPVVGLRQIMNNASPGLRRLVSQTILAACLSGLLTAQASAGGDVLRGGFATGPTYWNWRGFYVGAQANYNNGDVKFGEATTRLTDYILRNSTLLGPVSNWTTLPDGSTTGSSWGGFIGYNWQFEDAVVGFEANYSRMSLEKSASDSLSRQFADSNPPPGYIYVNSITVAGNAAVKLTDLATLRLRGGWSFGSLLPYGFIGFAVGRADVVTTASVTGTRDECPTANPLNCNTVNLLLPGPQINGQNGKWVYGGTVGLGFDWAMTENLFLRGEWELAQLQKIEGIDMRINTGRVALGVKF